MIKKKPISYPDGILNHSRRALKKAWEARNFEINNYWKRAAYFWAFQVASFAGYFGVIGSDFYNKNPEALLCVTCIGFITSLAWVLINKGSKSWQENWENHIDMLEDDITGPLYKTISMENNYSVSKINEIVSEFFVVIWGLLVFIYFLNNIDCLQSIINLKFYGRNLIKFLLIILTILFTLRICIKGKTNHEYKEKKFYDRGETNYEYKEKPFYDNGKTGVKNMETEKAGKHILSEFERLINANKLNEYIIQKLQEKEYTKNNLDINYPFLVKIELPKDVKTKAFINGHRRYYKDVKKILGNSYLITNDLYDRNIERFDTWVKSFYKEHS